MIESAARLVADLVGELEMKAGRAGFGDALAELGEENKNIVVLTADLAESTKVDGFRDRCPDRFFQVGVAEQNMMGIAAGLALTGKVPFFPLTPLSHPAVTGTSSASLSPTAARM